MYPMGYTGGMATPHTPHPRIAERERAGIHQIRSSRGLSTNDRIAMFITSSFGTMWAFYAFMLWMIGWVLLATAGVGFLRNDPYPFTFLLFLSNIVQLLALPILAVGQQVLSRASDKQAVQTYKDAEAILKLEDEVHRLITINNELTAEIHAAVLKR